MVRADSGRCHKLATEVASHLVNAIFIATLIAGNFKGLIYDMGGRYIR
jgi:hypothetical protein